jgi:hypothetical protein
MTNELQVPSLEEAKTYIDSIDFSQVVDRMVKKNKWKRVDVLKACELYRHFLFLQRKYGDDVGELPPSEDIDEFWHNHLLDTKKYMNDCDHIFGRYLHHYPYLGMDGKTSEADAAGFFQKTQELHYKEFGDYIFHVRNARFKHILSFLKQLVKRNLKSG